MRFLVDAQLPPALARWLSSQGHEADHVGDRGLAAANDTAIWDLALRTGSVVLTKDEDFVQRKSLRGGGPPVVWIRLPNLRRDALLVHIALVLPALLGALERGETLVEIV
jgi:predicted nuclease of predicted toxin-antitoxin system